MKVAVIGAGVVGALAAWNLARRGHEVVVLEQFQIDHDRGSSYGDSRIVRRVYADPFYTELMAEGYELWDELQSQAPDTELFCRAGGLFFGPADHPDVRSAKDALANAGVAHEVLDPAETRRRFPAVRLEDNEIALFEHGMGYARASNVVRTAARLAREAGATIREQVTVKSIEPGSAGTDVRILTLAGEEIEAERLLVAAGPWSGPLLGKLGVMLPLTVTRQAYLHLQPARHPESFEAGRFPVWIDAKTLYYGFPRLGDVPGVKIASHIIGQATTPQAVDREVHPDDREGTITYAATRFPDLSAEVAYEKVCLYTMTPDEDFVIDTVPSVPGAHFIAGLSGHGFKFGPLLGKIAADLVTGTPVRYDLSRFRADRFE